MPLATTIQPAVRVRRAFKDDAVFIHRLLQEAFQPYLAYTIYQSSVSVVHIRESIHELGDGSTQAMRVAELNGKIEGFYQASAQDDAFFLSYIAVARNLQSRGLGRILFADFEHSAASIGF